MTVWESNFTVDSEQDLFHTFDYFPIPNKKPWAYADLYSHLFWYFLDHIGLRKQTYGKLRCKESYISFELKRLMWGDQTLEYFWRGKLSDTEIEKAG